jgi:Golgi phosphoprotein 3 (GPP34)
MTTPRDLMFVTMDVPSSRPVERGNLSLALAGAELADLIAAGVLTLDGDRIVPGPGPAPDDRLLEEAAAALTRQVPYESVEDWLWRRGEGLFSAYLAALEAEGQITRQRPRWFPFGAGRTALADSPARRRAAHRWNAGEPVLADLAASLGIDGEPDEDRARPSGNALETVLATVHDAMRELDAVRQRRTIEKAAFDNIWRGG